MVEQGVDVLLLSLGADLPYFCGDEAMPVERLTMLIVPRDGDVHLVVPYLEAPRVVERPEVFGMVTWRDGEDPIARVADLASVGCDIVTIGQYLRPTTSHLEVDRWVEPATFDRWAAVGRALGIGPVEAGPFTRSSYHARQAAGVPSVVARTVPVALSARPG